MPTKLDLNRNKIFSYIFATISHLYVTHYFAKHLNSKSYQNINTCGFLRAIYSSVNLKELPSTGSSQKPISVNLKHYTRTVSRPWIPEINYEAQISITLYYLLRPVNFHSLVSHNYNTSLSPQFFTTNYIFFFLFTTLLFLITTVSFHCTFHNLSQFIINTYIVFNLKLVTHLFLLMFSFLFLVTVKFYYIRFHFEFYVNLTFHIHFHCKITLKPYKCYFIHLKFYNISLNPCYFILYRPNFKYFLLFLLPLLLMLLLLLLFHKLFLIFINITFLLHNSVILSLFLLTLLGLLGASNILLVNSDCSFCMILPCIHFGISALPSCDVIALNSIYQQMNITLTLQINWLSDLYLLQLSAYLDVLIVFVIYFSVHFSRFNNLFSFYG